MGETHVKVVKMVNNLSACAELEQVITNWNTVLDTNSSAVEISQSYCLILEIMARFLSSDTNKNRFGFRGLANMFEDWKSF